LSNKSEVKDVFALRTMVEADLTYVLKMRNNPNIRRYMKHSEIISEDEHKSWFKSKSIKSDVKLLVFLQNEILAGFVQFTINEDHSEAEWGFYKDYNSKQGIGLKLGNKAIEYIFANTKVKKITGEVLKLNTKSISFHRKLGFVEQKSLTQEFCGDTKNHSFVNFILSKPM